MVIALWAWIFPELRRAGELSAIKTAAAEPELEAGEGLT
jgi:hypothetical protein